MVKKEEKIARSLFYDITEYFSTKDINPTFKLEGTGVHWDCIVMFDDHKVSIYSCDLSHHPDKTGRVEEFIVSYFDNSNEEVSCGRTSDREKLIKSINVWLTHKSKDQLYKFDFIDLGLRKFKNLEREWIDKFPELNRTTRAIEHEGSGIVRYEISKNNRSCYSTEAGDEDGLYFAFTRDGCILFETETVSEETAAVLKRYLIDKDTPSSLSKEFSWIQTNILTESYEKGKGIEGEFIQSWKEIIEFYNKFTEKELPDKIEIIKLIQTLINHGFDKTLRAGQSLTKLILSRSRRHGLVENQPHLDFRFENKKIYMKTGTGEIYRFEQISLNHKILSLIKDLEKEKSHKQIFTYGY